ncbi:MAG: single-stranded DNA-binding protein [Nocardioidaceae bacterium]|nr:MAG: single-stranded DNA-binding protein [Nocardioidaceae bacterium]
MFRQPQGINVATFRVGSTPRIRRGGSWEDGDTTWYSVTAWRGLAENVRDSIKRGDAVIVHGRLRSHTWKKDEGDDITTLEVDAILVGHDLSRGTSAFLKRQRSAGAEGGLDAEVADMMVESIAEQEATPKDELVPEPV